MRRTRSRSQKNKRPRDRRLYSEVKREARQKFKAWPSAYASSWLVKEYKRRGGTYDGPYDGPYERKHKREGLGRWHRERWVDACEWPRRRPCARKSSTDPYPYCRPSVRVNSKTPRLVQTLTREQRSKLCRGKRSKPSRRSRALKKKMERRKKTKSAKR